MFALVQQRVLSKGGVDCWPSCSTCHGLSPLARRCHKFICKARLRCPGQSLDLFAAGVVAGLLLRNAGRSRPFHLELRETARRRL